MRNRISRCLDSVSFGLSVLYLRCRCPMVIRLLEITEARFLLIPCRRVETANGDCEHNTMQSVDLPNPH